MLTDNYARMVEAFRARKFVMIDNDGVLVCHSPSLHENCVHASALAVQEKLGATIGYDELRDMVYRSFLTYSSGLHVFAQEPHNLDHRELHFSYHKKLDHKLVQIDYALIAALENFHMPRAILSHGSHDWITRAHKQAKIREHFPDSCIYGLEKMNFHNKGISPAAYEHVLALTGYLPSEAIMIDDAAANLKQAKEIGITTIHVSQNNDHEYPFVDFTVDEVHLALIAAAEAHPMPRPDRPRFGARRSFAVPAQ